MLPQKDTKPPPLPTRIKSPERQFTLSLVDPRLEHMEEMDTQVDVEDLTSVVVVVSPTAAEVVKALLEDEVPDNPRTHKTLPQYNPKRRHPTMTNFTKSTLYHTWSSFFLTISRTCTLHLPLHHAFLACSTIFLLAKTKVQQNRSTHVLRLMPCFLRFTCIFTDGMDCGCHAMSLLRMGIFSEILKFYFLAFF